MIKKTVFGSFKNEDVYLYELIGKSGLLVKIMNLGATVTSIRLPDSQGEEAEIVCGFNTLSEYLSDFYQSNYTYFGSTVGRVANRIKDGVLQIEGVKYQLDVNNGSNHLHGGISGFDRKVWESEIIGDKVVMKLNVGHLEDGYPGNISVIVSFEIIDDNSLAIKYSATTDQSTVISMTNHSYFNLSGFQEGVERHLLHVPSAGIITKDDSDCPIGIKEEIPPERNFNSPKPIGNVELDDFLVFPESNEPIRLVGALSFERLGRRIEVYSSEKGAQIYNSKYVSLGLSRSNTQRYRPGCAICIETHDLPNLLGEYRSIMKPNDTYSAMTVYKFSWSV